MSDRKPRLVLLGKQGAGKGTQASRLAEHYGMADIATGDLFRAAAREGSPFGVEAQRFMEKGELVPDEIVIGVVEEMLGRDDTIRRGFILDGFPRTVRQAEELERVLADFPLDLVLDLDVPTEIVLRRIAGRRVCVQCNTPYHLDSAPAKNWTCDHCGSEVIQRDDDTEEAVMRRLELYEIQTLPLIHFYRRKGQLAHVDGTDDSDEVFDALLATVEDRVDRSGD